MSEETSGLMQVCGVSKVSMSTVRREFLDRGE